MKNKSIKNKYYRVKLDIYEFKKVQQNNLFLKSHGLKLSELNREFLKKCDNLEFLSNAGLISYSDYIELTFNNAKKD